MQHGGTFHFLQFNVLHSEEFINSKEFTFLVNFLNDNFRSQNQVELHMQSLSDFFKQINHNKSVIEINENINF